MKSSIIIFILDIIKAPKSLTTYTIKGIMAENYTDINRQLVLITARAVKKFFPIESASKILRLSGSLEFDVNKDRSIYTDIPAQKETKLKRKSWTIPLRSTVELVDKATGTVLSSKKIKLLDIPMMTNRYSFILDGNEYSSMYQWRLKPGIYTRLTNDGFYESNFNLALAKLDLRLDPETLLFYLMVGGSSEKFYLYPILKSFGVLDSRMKSLWGSDIFEKNMVVGTNNEGQTLIGFAKKVARLSTEDSKNLMIDAAKNLIEKYFAGTQLDAKVLEKTIGISSSKIDAEVLVATSSKLLKVMRGELPEDERDSLAYKNLYNVADRVNYFLERNLKAVSKKLQFKMRNRTDVAEILTPDALPKIYKSSFLKDELISPNPQTNPLEILLESRKTTVMGAGGIQSTHAITEEVRNLHPSHIGILDPLQTPEGKKVGITLPLSVYTIKDKQEVKTSYWDRKGNNVLLSPIEAADKVLGFPGEYSLVNGIPVAKGKKVKGYKGGQPGYYDAAEIDLYLKGAHQLWSLGSSMIPFLNSNSGNRASMAGRQMTQAVQLVNPEPPLVLSLDENTGKPWAQVFGEALNVKPVSRFKGGKVVEITRDYIHLKEDETGKIHKIGLYNNFPLNQESFLDSTPTVNIGDRVTRESILARTNFQSPDGSLALGKNVNVAYMPWKGLNVEDATVVTETAANKMFVSESMQRETLMYDKKTILDLSKYRALFPMNITEVKSKKYDEEGIIKPGETVEKDDYVIMAIRKKELTPEQISLSKLNKLLATPYADVSIKWDFEEPGEVVYVNKGSKKIDVHIKMKSPLKVGDKLCVDEETEVLTDTGWKSYDTMSLSDKVCTLNSLSKEIEYEIPEKINIYSHSGKMYKINNSSIDQCVTLNHKMYVKLRDSEKFELYAAENIIGKRAKYLKSGIWSGHSIEIPSIFNCTEEQYIQFMAWYLSKGSCFISKKGDYRITISQSKKKNPDKYQEILLLLKVMGFNVHEYSSGVVFQNKNVCLYLKQFGKANERFIPDNIKQATKESIYLFLITYTKGDGNFTKTGQSVITTNSILMRDGLMELWLKAGYSSTYKLAAKEGSFILRNRVNYDVWNIRQIRAKLSPQVNHGHINSQKVQIEEIVDYSGIVWCPTTKNGIIYIRRNGKCVWTGNSGLVGNKMIVSKIIPDSEAPHTEDGRRADLVMHPFGVIGRANIGQLLAQAAGKVVLKTGKPYTFYNFENESNVDKILSDLKKYNVIPNEIMTDGVGGKKFERPIFYGPQYVMKLKHMVDHKIKSRSFGSYDVNEQVVRGDKGGQSIDPLQWYALIAHGLKQNLAETTKYLNVRNDEFWRAIQLNLPIPKVNRNFVWDKFASYLKGTGIDLKRDGNTIKMIPSTDKDLLEISSGEILQPKFIIGKNLAEIKGGFFDPKITGGMSGEKWSHIELADKILNPIYEDTVQKLMGLTKKDFAGKLEAGTLMTEVDEFLSKLNVPNRLAELTDKIKTAKKLEIPKINYQIRVLQNLKNLKLTPKDVYMMKYLPIIPPKFRPIYPLPNGDLNTSPINFHYRDVGLMNAQLREARLAGIDTKDVQDASIKLYKSVKAAQGLGDPVTYDNTKEGILRTLAGDTPGDGFIQGKLWRKRRDLSGRSVATVNPNLGIDEIGIPNTMLWEIYRPFIIKELISLGLSPMEAAKQYKEKSSLADKVLDSAISKRPIIMNRAPSLHKHSAMAFKPRRTNEISIQANPLIFSGYNLDFDGDQVMIYPPVTTSAVEEAWNAMPSKVPYRSGTKSVLHGHTWDYKIGLYYATKKDKRTNLKFRTIEEARAYIPSLKYSDVFDLNGQEMTLGQWEVNEVLPEDMRDYSREIDAKVYTSMLEDILEKHPNDFSNVINKWKDIGFNTAFIRGQTLSITDMKYDNTVRNKLIEEAKKDILARPKDFMKIMSSMEEKITVDQRNKIKKEKNNAWDWIESKALSGSKAKNIDQVLSLVGVVEDLKGEPVKVPIFKSWAEGQDPFDYWSTLYGARKGSVDKAIRTQDSGYLNKSLLINTARVLVTEDNCETDKYIDETQLSAIHLIGRVLGKTVSGVGFKDEVITREKYNEIKRMRLRSVPVRSPLTCEAKDDGVCQLCYGWDASNKFPYIGDNVGISDATALTEPLTQGSLRSFHSGGKAGILTPYAGYPRADEILRLKKNLQGGGVLSTVSGNVEDIAPNPAGGFNIVVKNKTHYIPLGRELTVKIHDKVSAGDPLSDGVYRPQDIAEYKGIDKAREYMVNELQKTLENKDNIMKRTVENVVKAITNRVIVEDPKEDNELVRGDIMFENTIKRMNRERKEDGLEPIKFKPYLQNIDLLPLTTSDWSEMIGARNIKKVITESAAIGRATNIHGTHPLPAYMYAVEFGNKEKSLYY